jgi:hypothetical protein
MIRKKKMKKKTKKERLWFHSEEFGIVCVPTLSIVTQEGRFFFCCAVALCTQIDGLGSTSLAVLYLSLTISSLGAPFVVMRLGSKNAILFALSGYWTFIVANLFPSW